MTRLLRALALPGLALALCPALFALAGCDVVELAAQSQTGGFDRTLTVNGPVDLDVRTGSGGIRVDTSAGNSVHVVARIRASSSLFDDSAASRIKEIEAHPPIEQNGGTIRIGQMTDRDSDLYQNISISYEITVPFNSTIRSASGSGSHHIGSVNGSITAHSGSGDLDIAQSGGTVVARTGSGTITIERAAGRVEAQAGSGDIRAGSVGGAIRARTGSGSVEMTQVARADADVHTGSGSVRLSLPENAAFDLTAQTGSGSIHVVQPMSARVQSRHRLEGSVRGGGTRVTISTGSGSITIR